MVMGGRPDLWRGEIRSQEKSFETKRDLAPASRIRTEALKTKEAECLLKRELVAFLAAALVVTIFLAFLLLIL